MLGIMLYCLQDTISSQTLGLVVVQPLAERAGNGIVHTTCYSVICHVVNVCMQETFARATHSALRPAGQVRRATIGYLVYKVNVICHLIKYWTPYDWRLCHTGHARVTW